MLRIVSAGDASLPQQGKTSAGSSQNARDIKKISGMAAGSIDNMLRRGFTDGSNRDLNPRRRARKIASDEGGAVQASEPGDS